ncbi:MAG: domain S-box-containing protein [Marmoricola sp.]|nr:domain S-box-containing protein [Marmoricola sp.]
MAQAGVRVVEDEVLALLAAVPHPVVASTPDGTIGYANPRALVVFGYTASELLGRPVEVLVPAEHAATYVRLLAAYAASPESQVTTEGTDLFAVRRDGTQFPTEISLLPLETATGTWVVATIRDLTARAEAAQRLRDSNRAYLTLARTNQAIVRAADAPALFREVCRIAVVHGGYLGAWVGVADGGRVRRVATAGALEDYVAALDIRLDPADPRGRGPTAVALREGTAYFSPDFRADAATGPWHALAAPFGIAASATLPLRCGGRVVAVMSLYSQRSHLFDDQMRELLLAMGENVSFALDGFDSARRVVEVARERSLLSERLVVAQEEERDRIAADLHDESVQVLASLDLRLGLLSRRLEGRARDLVPELEQARADLVGVGRQLRDLLFELETPDGGQTPLQMVRDVAGHALDGVDLQWDVELVTDTSEPASVEAVMSPMVLRQAVRMVKESLANVRKHAGATHVSIELVPTRTGLEVTVRDDGVGFDPARAPSPGHRGLKNLADRAAVVGGWLRVDRGDPGTTVRFWVPASVGSGPGPAV